MEKIETEWIYLDGYIDPPDTPERFEIEVRRDYFFGIVIAYRFVKKEEND